MRHDLTVPRVNDRSYVPSRYRSQSHLATRRLLSQKTHAFCTLPQSKRIFQGNALKITSVISLLTYPAVLPCPDILDVDSLTGSNTNNF